jgi:redox-sensitive bicupin YhaK (pirin superfamily)
VLTDTTGEIDEAPVLDVSGNRSLILFDRGDEVVVTAGPDGVRFLLVSGQPLAEPVAWHGPIVMNTQGEIRRALQDLREGTFIR